MTQPATPLLSESRQTRVGPNVGLRLSVIRIVLVLILSLFTLGCQHAKPIQAVYGNADLGLSDQERAKLKRESADGNAASTWQLYLYYSLFLQDQTAADPWLKRAAELHHAGAQTTLAYLVKEYKHDPAGFGSTGPEAVKVLLENSSRTEGNACYQLASAYAEGYFGAADYTKAREYFERGASFGNRMCWTELSRYYRQGIGGPRHDTEAYYWISLEARCTDPRSMGGQATWAAREQIAETLSIDELQKEWTRIDDYIAKVEAKKLTVDFAPFLSGMIDPKVEAEGRKLAMERENEHRTKWRQRKPPPE
jgi:hypothetical protein